MSEFGMEEGARPFVFDFETYEKVATLGFFEGRAGRVELIEGVIVDMAPAGMQHGRVNSDLLARLHAAVSAAAITGLDVVSNVTLRIDDRNAPEPDVLVARPPSDGRYYGAEDAVLVVEVSVATRDSDRKIKAPLYARAGIAEYWLVEPEARTVRIYRRPGDNGEWGEEATISHGAITPLFSPAITIALVDVFRPL